MGTQTRARPTPSWKCVLPAKPIFPTRRARDTPLYSPQSYAVSVQTIETSPVPSSCHVPYSTTSLPRSSSLPVNGTSFVDTEAQGFETAATTLQTPNRDKRISRFASLGLNRKRPEAKQMSQPAAQVKKKQQQQEPAAVLERIPIVNRTLPIRSQTQVVSRPRSEAQVVYGKPRFTNSLVTGWSRQNSKPSRPGPSIITQSMEEEKYFEHMGYFEYMSGTRDDRRHRLLDLGSEVAVKFEERALRDYEARPMSMNKVVGKDLEINEVDKTGAIRLTVQKFAAEKTIAEDYKSHVENLSDDEATEQYETSKYELVDDDMESPRTGNVTTDKLWVRVRNIRTQEIDIYNFEYIQESSIDWNSTTRMQEIFKWRTLVFRRHDLVGDDGKLKNMYMPEEEAWLAFFHMKLKAVVEAGSIIRLPGPSNIMAAFNNFFEGKVIEKLPPREARDESSLKGKLNNKRSDVWKMRDVTRKLLEGKGKGEIYVPTVSEAELSQYRKDGTVEIDTFEEVGRVMAAGLGLKRKRGLQDGGEQGAKRAKVAPCTLKPEAE